MENKANILCFKSQMKSNWFSLRWTHCSSVYKQTNNAVQHQQMLYKWRDLNRAILQQHSLQSVMLYSTCYAKWSECSPLSSNKIQKIDSLFNAKQQNCWHIERTCNSTHIMTASMLHSSLYLTDRNAVILLHKYTNNHHTTAHDTANPSHTMWHIKTSPT